MPSPAAKRKAASKQTEPVNGTKLPLHSFRTLLTDLATMTRNVICFGGQKVSIVATNSTERKAERLS